MHMPLQMATPTVWKPLGQTSGWSNLVWQPTSLHSSYLRGHVVHIDSGHMCVRLPAHRWLDSICSNSLLFLYFFVRSSISHNSFLFSSCNSNTSLLHTIWKPKFWLKHVETDAATWRLNRLGHSHVMFSHAGTTTPNSKLRWSVRAHDLLHVNHAGAFYGCWHKVLLALMVSRLSIAHLGLEK